MCALIRYVPAGSLPDYAFIPGRTPHPNKDPRGHSYGVEETPSSALSVDNWTEHPDYLWGIDLYNHGYPWEAHESWEGPWRLAARNTSVRHYLQGLIQCSAAVVKAMSGRVAGVRSLSGTGLALLAQVPVTDDGRYMGLHLAPFIEAFRGFADSYPDAPDRWPKIELRW